jgi:spermidine/putrescine transport system substrate-binding protein
MTVHRGTTSGPPSPRRRPRPPDPAVAAILGLSRRRFLRNTGLGGALLLGGNVLAACGIGGDETPAADGETGDGGGNGDGNQLVIANWPLYIDLEEDETTSPTLLQFEDETGISVEYLEEVNSNDEWFARFSNQLGAGQAIGRDITVLTDWMAGRMIARGWVEEIDRANVPNAEANMLDALREVQFDPGRRYSLTWQSGMTGIGYNPGLTGRALSSVNDLFADDLAGQVTFLTEMRDTMGFVLASMGADPANHEFSEYEAAIAKLQGAVDSGQVRAFTGNEYAADLAAGNIAACLAWSGDVIQLQFDDPDLQFAIPAEGASLWSDNMLIPAGAANKANAEAFMDFVYRPEIAAQIAAWVNYISPVDGAQAAMEELDPELVEEELIFPSAETLEGSWEFKTLESDEEAEYQRLFQAVIGA